MTRDYKKNKTRKKQPNIKPGVVFSTGMIVGICLCFIVYQVVQKQSVERTHSEHTAVAKTDVSLTELNEQSQTNTSVTPTFEFYNILPDRELAIAEWESEEPVAKKTVPTEIVKNTGHNGYILQLGSFRSFKSADQVKAKLALLGINASIQKVVIDGNNIFHRVRVGPYKSTGKLEEAQERLLANDYLNFSVLKLSIDDL